MNLVSKEVEFSNKKFRLVKIKSIHKPSLKQVSFFLKLFESGLFKKVIIIESTGFKLKSPSITL